MTASGRLQNKPSWICGGLEASGTFSGTGAGHEGPETPSLAGAKEGADATEALSSLAERVSFFAQVSRSVFRCRVRQSPRWYPQSLKRPGWRPQAGGRVHPRSFAVKQQFPVVS